MWSQSKECTDPLKFIYEDLAITAYLIALWRKTSSHPKAFADLGCGNGLLVYILTEEGYLGYGYDVRSRNIWSYYPKKVQSMLIEETIDPLHIKLPFEVDWLIGNHSDELSPWVPVVAACAHYEMKYFLLPCCGYEFCGSKYQRRNSKFSAYNDFLNYVTNISSKCGFITKIDRLKIPSTKRIAVLSIERIYSKPDFQQQCFVVRQLIADDCQSHGAIKFRNKREPVRNCTQIDKIFLDEIVSRIFQFMLTPTEVQENTTWNTGRKLRIQDLLKCLQPSDLKSIKSECGGLKTLLKNKHDIFEFLSHDLIQIRKPSLLKGNETKKLQTVKKRKCYFLQYHPNGCPLSDDQCTFLHS